MPEVLTAAGAGHSPIHLGLKENGQQFAMLLLVNAFVGGMVGLERTVVPLIGSEEFKLDIHHRNRLIHRQLRHFKSVHQSGVRPACRWLGA